MISVPPAEAVETPLRVVVAGVVVRDGRVLVARRTRPAALAGRWEFPGGKVEDGETEPEALVRELTEELGVEVRVRQVLGRWPLPGGYELAAYGCDLVAGTPTARPDDAHDAVSWLAPAGWDDLVWLDADRALLPAVAAFVATA